MEQVVTVLQMAHPLDLRLKEEALIEVLVNLFPDLSSLRQVCHEHIHPLT